jgi:hypothetical protein
MSSRESHTWQEGLSASSFPLASAFSRASRLENSVGVHWVSPGGIMHGVVRP